MFRRSRALAAKQVCIEGDSWRGCPRRCNRGASFWLGLRRSELVRLDAADLHSGDGVLTIQGKGNELRNEDQGRYRLRFDHLIIPEWRIVFYARTRGVPVGELYRCCSYCLCRSGSRPRARGDRGDERNRAGFFGSGSSGRYRKPS
jgi:hypothetical protein